jgi:hypothetical protein
MSSLKDEQVNISLEFAERLVLQLCEATRETGRESLLRDAESLQSQIDAQCSRTPPHH